MQFRLLVLSLAFLSVSVGACNCNPILYSYPGQLKGLICGTASGQPLTNIGVTVTDGKVKFNETTDGNGDFVVKALASGKATVTVHDPAGDRTVDVIITSNDTTRFSDATCHAPPPAAGGEIDGCVCDQAAGAWVQNASAFVITSAAQGGSVVNATTDAQGCFKLLNVPAGPQTVQVQKGAFFQSDDITVVADQTVSLPAVASCVPTPPPPGSGTVDGRVCAPDGQTWLAGATVSVTRPDGSTATTTTDGNGAYTLAGVPAGNDTVNISKGSFSSTVNVVVTSGQTTTVPDDQCSLTSPSTKIAVVTGQYDKVESVLSLIGVDPANVTTYDGYTQFPTQWNSELLDDYATLSQYNIVFLNCGLDDNPIVEFGDTTAINNLKQFVQNGGSLYASDWAYSIIETAWPNEIDFYGNDTTFSDFNPGGPKFGNQVTGLSGIIVDPGLATGMGSSAISLDYELYEWVVMQSVASDVTVYITADAPLEDGTSLSSVPHTIGFNAGAGRVLYTSFHQEPGVNQGQQKVLQLLMFEL